MHHKKTTNFLSRIQMETGNSDIPPCITILCREFERRIARNNNYSVRAFARDLGLNPGHLSRIIVRKRTMRYETAEVLCERMGLAGDEKKEFLKSARHTARLNQMRRHIEQAKSC